MSYAIFDLDLEEPPATVHRTRNGRWVVRCEVCNYKTAARPMLSAALRDEKSHARGHYKTMLAAHIKTHRRPQNRTHSVPNRLPIGGSAPASVGSFDHHQHMTKTPGAA